MSTQIDPNLKMVFDLKVVALGKKRKKNLVKIGEVLQ